MLLPVLLLTALSQVPCTQVDNTVVCKCKQLDPSGCEALKATDPAMYERIQKLIEAAGKAKAAGEAAKAVSESQDKCQPDPSAPEECTGDIHHPISMTVWRALERNEKTKGQFKHRDRRFETRARRKEDHCYDRFHRSIDSEVADWVDATQPTPEQFLQWLRQRYRASDLIARFPNGF